MTSVNLEKSVKVRAFELYLERGSIHGFDQEDWFRAENELRGKSAMEKPDVKSAAPISRKGK